VGLGIAPMGGKVDSDGIDMVRQLALDFIDSGRQLALDFFDSGRQLTLDRIDLLAQFGMDHRDPLIDSGNIRLEFSFHPIHPLAEQLLSLGKQIEPVLHVLGKDAELVAKDLPDHLDIRFRHDPCSSLATWHITRPIRPVKMVHPLEKNLPLPTGGWQPACGVFAGSG
jgi:hypothetical protein